MGYITFIARRSPASISATDITAMETKDISICPEKQQVDFSRMKPGENKIININIRNIGQTDIFYYLHANWKVEEPATTEHGIVMAKYLQIIASTLNPQTSEAEIIYSGPLSELLDKPDSPGRELSLTRGNEDIELKFIIPRDIPRYLEDIEISVEFTLIIL
ncbi:MAG: hypothetical protein WAO23_09555 [Dethiobacteria bacterium]